MKHKISEQQINPKVLLVASSCDYNGNSKWQKIPAPRELSQQIPNPWPKARMQKPPGGGKFLVLIPRSVRGGWLWMKLIPA